MSESKQTESQKVRVLFVCMGNICRSPTAHGVFRKLVVERGLSHCVEIDSAGTHAYHVGEPPDRRARATALERGIDIGDLRARLAERSDFESFDYVLAMDRDNYRILSGFCPAGMESKLRLFMEFAPDLGVRDVPDPYYGGAGGFDQVFDLVEAASQGLLEDLLQRHLR
ncbi:low molecular weight protein-tyrosine-phosphatase [Thiocapsa bogorovii]|uniref:low molecular weight protein-tyrosine-phosphatase n=1 Tax=Thiocapsa bogorovii TaxID=521689 RepID=UPI001E4552C8|nr:low molecular weight protein-tyrosine-phosphatase [Thiocapsa bogorovii]UHD17700.1 low molecular weight phosphotyrosine protein phosphatase [Thiocapsa bogorovii]